MIRLTVRLPEDIHELLKYEALRQKQSLNHVLTEAVCSYIAQTPNDALHEIKRAVVSARSKGRRPLVESLRLAKKVAALDDEEGLGTIKVHRNKSNQ